MPEPYIQIENSPTYIERLTPLWIAYMREIAHGDLLDTTDDEITDWLIKRAEIQGQRDTMHFELIYSGENLAGFAMYAIDLGGIKGILDGGMGYIMEFYIVPELRRKGIATRAFAHMERVLTRQGARQIYLTPDSVSGVPFWERVGFRNSGKTDPDNKMPIYIKETRLESGYDSLMSSPTADRQ